MKKTYKERQAENELVDRVQAAGIPVAIESGKDEASSLLIRQDFDDYESVIFNLNGGTGLIVPIKITVDMPLFVFSGVDIRLSRWPDARFRPLEENDHGEWPHYEFWGRSERKFHRNETINRFLGGRTQFRRAEFFRGSLLASATSHCPKISVAARSYRVRLRFSITSSRCIPQRFPYRSTAKLNASASQILKGKDSLPARISKHATKMHPRINNGSKAAVSAWDIARPDCRMEQ